MDFIVSSLLLSALVLLLYFLFRSRDDVALSGIPLVPGCLPLIGHSWYFLTNLNSFFLSCYTTTRSPVFRLRIFGQNWVYFCDKSYTRDFFKGSESTLSVFSLFNLHEAFATPGFDIQRVFDALRSGFNIPPQEYLGVAGSVVENNLTWLENRLPLSSNHTHNLHEMARRLHDVATAECLLGVGLNEKALEACVNYENAWHRSAAICSLVSPQIVRWVVGPWLKRTRDVVVGEVVATLPKYQEDSNNIESRLMRLSADSINTETGRRLTSEDVKGIICAALMGGPRNMPILFANTLADLATKEECWIRAREEVEQVVERRDWEALLNLPYLAACIAETERRSVGIWTFQRITKSESYKIGEHTIPPNTMVALNAPLMQIYGPAEAEYESPEEYNPSRFLGCNKATNLLTFGGGKHLCPGKQFSLHLTKIAVALFLINFDLELIPKKDFSLDYYVFSTLAERRFTSRITKRTKS